MSRFRIGLGFDIHRTKKNIPLMLGGCYIPCEFGLISNTDGDVILHAVIDSLLALIGFSDIGTLFPPEKLLEDRTPSEKLMRTVMSLEEINHLTIHQVDVTILAEVPKLQPFYEKIRNSLSRLLNIEADKVTVKARSFEGLGEIGRGEAIAAYAIVLGEKVERKTMRKEISSVTKRELKPLKIADYPGEVGFINIFVDGASKGNPGPSACGFVVYSAEGNEIASRVKFLGQRTNNEAEYEAVYAALQYLKESFDSNVTAIVNTDSKLVFSQLTGQYKVKGEKLKILHEKTLNIASSFTNVAIRLIGRGRNSSADSLVHKELDRFIGIN